MGGKWTWVSRIITVPLWWIGLAGVPGDIKTLSEGDFILNPLITLIDYDFIRTLVVILAAAIAILSFDSPRKSLKRWLGMGSDDFDIKAANEGKDLQDFFEYCIGSTSGASFGGVTLFVDPRTKKKRDNPAQNDQRKTYGVTACVTEISYWFKNDIKMRPKTFWVLKKPRLKAPHTKESSIEIDADHIGNFRVGWHSKDHHPPAFHLGNGYPHKSCLSRLEWRGTLLVIMVNIKVKAPHTRHANVRVNLEFNYERQWTAKFAGVIRR